MAGVEGSEIPRFYSSRSLPCFVGEVASSGSDSVPSDDDDDVGPIGGHDGGISEGAAPVVGRDLPSGHAGQAHVQGNRVAPGAPAGRDPDCRSSFKGVQALGAAHTVDGLPSMSSVLPRPPCMPKPTKPLSVQVEFRRCAHPVDSDGDDDANCNKSPLMDSLSAQKDVGTLATRPTKSAPAAAVRAAFNEVRVIAEDSSWALVDCAKSQCAAKVVAQVDPDAAGVIVVAEPCDGRSAMRAVDAIAARELAVPVCVLLVDFFPDDAAACDIVMVQQRLEEVGADDVALAVPGGSLRAALAMSMQRAKRRCKDEASARRRLASSGQMFWSCAHRVFSGFPMMDKQAPEDPGQVGSTWLQLRLTKEGSRKVYLGVNRESGRHEAVKLVQKSSLPDLGAVANMWQEFAILSKFKHPNIARLYGISHMRSFIALHLEFGGSMTLLEHLLSRPDRALQVLEVWEIGAQVASALEYCHSLGVAHRDVKPASVAMPRRGDPPHQSPVVKLVGFGMALEEGAQATDVRCGTMPFCPPEMLKGVTDGLCTDLDYRQSLDPRPGDVWSLGVVLLETVGGYGIMNRIMGWPDSVRPCRERGEELRRRFGAASSLGRAVETHSVRRVSPAVEGFSVEQTLPLLTSMLHPSSKRCSMAYASSQLRAQWEAVQAMLVERGSRSRKRNTRSPSASTQELPRNGKPVGADFMSGAPQGRTPSQRGRTERGKQSELAERPSIAAAEIMVAEATLQAYEQAYAAAAAGRHPSGSGKPGSGPPGAPADNKDSGGGWRIWTGRSSAGKVSTCEVLSPVGMIVNPPTTPKPEQHGRPGRGSRAHAAAGAPVAKKASSPRAGRDGGCSSSSRPGSSGTCGSLEPCSPRSESPAAEAVATATGFRRRSSERSWAVGSAVRWLSGRSSAEGSTGERRQSPAEGIRGALGQAVAAPRTSTAPGGFCD
mmetsp:Transcript_65051/g.188627  ORF Transcript_65051/g.188627 Transcript_65051/m.188627 type:complete len:941 (-) Transcript_65051:131-2953(-)